ncbi:MAG: hypothetical protein MMC23_003908 [Stictis urceolatum]|nr:hypothetical protein [Stictis urceolata]
MSVLPLANTQVPETKQTVLLVPTTEVLVSNKDRESDTPYSELVTNEDFLSSHVLRIPPPGTGTTKEVGNIRENRSKARQFHTVNGKTVVIKESLVYSNKGFRNLNQAQLLADTLYYQDGLEVQQWLIYYISKPLLGTVEPIRVVIARSPGDPEEVAVVKSVVKLDDGSDAAGSSTSTGKKDIKSFHDVLAHFPMIARQMQPGLERVINDFSRDVSKPLPALSSKSPAPSTRSRRSSSASRTSSTLGSVLGGPSYSYSRRASISSFTAFSDDEEDFIRRTLETAVIAAIDLFQLVDKQQLSLLGATTELTGPVVERLIERYITEQVHFQILFPRMCSIHHLEDLELETCVRHMFYIDVAQVGIDIEGGHRGKDQILARLNNGIEEFKKLSEAGCPQSMLDILLETQKIMTTSALAPLESQSTSTEKPKPLTMNADTLVSLLLIVVIRSKVRHLQARLACMKSFIFIDDVESGEMGYALSTLEAVLSYLTTDSGGLRVASRRNRRLWQATRKGNLSEMRTILEPDDGSISDEPDSMIGSSTDYLEDDDDNDGATHNEPLPSSNESCPPPREQRLARITDGEGPSSEPGLSHVFPFQRLNDTPQPRPRPVKQVSIDLRSVSSDISFHSRTSTLTSITSVIDGDLSIDTLCQTQDLSGNSVLMMAVEANQPEALDYLLSLEDHYYMQAVLEDVSSEGTTLLSAAVQMANPSLIGILVDYICSLRDIGKLQEYLYKSDSNGRTVAHYLFHAPLLIQRFNTLLPWRHRDKNGQTPLLALCRSYDHPAYPNMVNAALQSATAEQNDGQPLHLDKHVDSKGNTLLHVVSDPLLALRILQHCDTDPNAPNEKQFTPLMVASKFGRFDLVRALFLDNRVDVQAKEYRGMTAVELAKDDELRNRMDDMMLVSNVPGSDGRVTAVVRSFFVEDATIRLIIKTAARSGDGMIAVTTCRRSLADFEHLAKWLAIEHPASWLPAIFTFRSPFQLPSKPSRAVLHDIQIRLDKFLQIMLAHSTFSTHELLWEFIMIPDIQPDMLAERSLLKSFIRQEKIKEDYTPLADYRDVETFVTHARESVRAVNHSTKSSLRRVNNIRNATSDLHTALDLTTRPLSTLPFLPPTHTTAFARYTHALRPTESDPYKLFHADLLAISSTLLATLSSLARPHALISSAQTAQKALDRHRGSLRRSDRWPLNILEETRRQAQMEAQEKMEAAEEELRVAGCELRYTQQTVASELAGWQDLHGKMARRAVGRLVKRMVVRERVRLEGMRRALRGVLEAREEGERERRRRREGEGAWDCES